MAKREISQHEEVVVNVGGVWQPGCAHPLWTEAQALHLAHSRSR